MSRSDTVLRVQTISYIATECRCEQNTDWIGAKHTQASIHAYLPTCAASFSIAVRLLLVNLQSISLTPLSCVCPPFPLPPRIPACKSVQRLLAASVALSGPAPEAHGRRLTNVHTAKIWNDMDVRSTRLPLDAKRCWPVCWNTLKPQSPQQRASVACFEMCVLSRALSLSASFLPPAIV